MLIAQIGADSEAVRHTAEQVDLPGLAGLDEGSLGLVAELGGEDLVDFCSVSLVLFRWGVGFVFSRSEEDATLRTGSSNGKGTLDSAQFLMGDERRVSRVSDVDLAGLQEAADILREISHPASWISLTRQKRDIPSRQSSNPPHQSSSRPMSHGHT